ncbi:transglycosylase family protein [Nakamurella sp. A5-74]|uniref:Transglycosylase family protein n=1 Tax=Nakamurella sp. A5-74 TaxID=3158264 RepID=A0AAU8DME5_9ACTN
MSLPPTSTSRPIPPARDHRVLPGGWILPEHRDAVLADQLVRGDLLAPERAAAVIEGAAATPFVGGRIAGASAPEAAGELLPETPRSSRRRPAMVAIAASFLVLVTAAGPTFGDTPKTVTLSLDGGQRIVATNGGSVRDALLAAGVDAGPRDLVAPALDAPIENGSRVTVRRARLVTMQIEGRARQWWTTAKTVDQALLEMGVRAGDYRFSADRSREISLAGTIIVGEPLRWVTVVDGRHAAVRTRLAASTVQQVLAERKISIGRYDRVAPTVGSAVHNGQRITITRVRRSQRIEHTTVPQPAAVVEQDATIGKGNTVQVSKGSPGLRTITVSRTVTNGSPADKMLSDTLTRQAAPAVTKIGTKETGLPESWSVPWDKMAFCESTNRWDVNTGNGTYGGLQFMTPTWLEYDGGEFAPRADEASKEQQIIVAERLYAREGLAPWHCARLLGWGFDKYEG